MPKRIPVSAAKKIAEELDCRQIILLAWDGKLTHVLTYGNTLEDCAVAAEGGNILKKKWDWPERLMAQPPRIKKLQDEIKQLKAKLAEVSR